MTFREADVAVGEECKISEKSVFPAALAGILSLVFFASMSVSLSEARVVRDARGVAFEAVPRKRIVSLAPNVTEMLFFLGMGDRVVGVTRFCNYPEGAKEITKVGGMADPDPEAILALSPDLVVATVNGNPRHVIETVERLGVECFVIRSDDIGGILSSMRSLADLLRPPPGGMLRLEKLEREYKELVRTEPKEKIPAIMLFSVDPPIAAGGKTFLEEVFELAGARNVLADSVLRYPHLTMERIISLAPRFVFVTRGMGESGLQRFVERLNSLTEGRMVVVEVNGDLFTRPGPRTLAAVRELRRALGRN